MFKELDFMNKPLRLKLAIIIGTLWVLFQSYTAFFGELSTIPQRSVHLAFAMTVLYLTHPLGEKWDKKYRWFGWLVDFLCIVLGLITTLYLAKNDVVIASRLGITNPVEIIYGTLLVIIVLDATRRVVGWPLPIIALCFIMYALWGNLIPGYLGHRPYSFIRIISNLYLMTEGIFGVALGVSAGFLFVFIMFASFLKESGGGQLFCDFATGIAGRARGGPAKIAVVASGFFGSISGSAVANVVGTGSFTIPLMKSIGYRPQFAGAVEAVASTGGVLMPPVMGATAFVMAELLQIPYLEVAKAAVIPAILYYLSLFVMVHLEALKIGLRGLRGDELPDVKKVLKEYGHLALPLVVMVYLLVKLPDSPGLAGALSTVFIILVAALRKKTRMSIGKLIMTFFETSKSALDVAMTCACVGIVVGIVMLTGLGNKLAGVIVAASGGSPLLLLVFTAISSLILGMGLPITPAYLILVVIVGPVLDSMGFLPIAAHLFMLYFGAISFITPPVALAAYAGAAIAGANAFSTGFTATRLGIAGFLVPFAFAYNPVLLLIGSPGEVILAVITATLGVVVLAMGVQGYAFRKLAVWERIILLVGAPLMIVPGLTTDLIGAAISGIVVVPQMVSNIISIRRKNLINENI